MAAPAKRSLAELGLTDEDFLRILADIVAREDVSADKRALLGAIREKWDAFPPCRLRLFLSADIVGSTAHKQRNVVSDGADNPNPWLHPFTGFYADIEGQLAAEWDALRKRLKAETQTLLGDAPTFWKGLGDEAIYTLVARNPVHVCVAVAVFVKVLTYLDRELGGKAPGLSVKGTAWLAGFPVNNSELVLGAGHDDLLRPMDFEVWFLRHFVRVHLHELQPADEDRLDFIGPQMDLGFRLCKLSSPRRMSLSLDLAHLLATQGAVAKDAALRKYAPRFSVHSKLHFGGNASLKGVLGGLPYPVYWLDVSPSHQSSAERALRRASDRVTKEAPILPRLVAAHCAAFVERHRERYPWLCLPFIWDHVEGRYDRRPPPFHFQRYEIMHETWKHDLLVWARAGIMDEPDPGTDPRESERVIREAVVDGSIMSQGDGPSEEPGGGAEPPV